MAEGPYLDYLHGEVRHEKARVEAMQKALDKQTAVANGQIQSDRLNSSDKAMALSLERDLGEAKASLQEYQQRFNEERSRKPERGKEESLRQQECLAKEKADVQSKQAEAEKNVIKDEKYFAGQVNAMREKADPAARSRYELAADDRQRSRNKADFLDKKLERATSAHERTHSRDRR